MHQVKLLLAKSITLLYRESLIEDKSTSSDQLVKAVLDTIKIPDMNLTINHERDMIYGLRQTAAEMCDNAATATYEKTELLQRIKMNCGIDEPLFENIASGIEPELQEASIKKSIVNIRKFLFNYQKELKVREIFQKANSDFNYNREKIKDVNDFIASIITSLEPYQMDTANKEPGVVESLDFDDVQSVDAFVADMGDMISEDNSKYYLKTGLQELNTILHGGFKRGELTCVTALSTKGKSLCVRTFFEHIARFNAPNPFDSSKKPLLIWYSLEEEINVIMKNLYETFKEQETGKATSIKGKDPTEVADYVKSILQKTGFHVKFRRIDGPSWGYRDYQNSIVKFEAEGYEVVATVIDYMSCMSRVGCTLTTLGSDLEDLMMRIANFGAIKKIVTLTVHQASTAVKDLMRNGIVNVLKEIEGKGYYLDARALERKMHVEINVHQTIAGGVTWQEINVVKLKSEVLDKANSYMAYPLHKVGTLKPDLNGENTARKKIGGDPKGTPEESASFFSFANER